MTSKPRQLTILALLVAVAVGSAVMSEEAPPSDQRATAQKAFEKGNWRDAYNIYSKLALDPKDDPQLVGVDLTQAIQCLHQLGRLQEIDGLREGVIKAHEKNWRLLHTAAQSYLQQPQFGYVVAGKFERGHHRGGGEMVNSVERDRARAMQLMHQGLAAARADDDKQAASQYLFDFAGLLLNNRGHYDAWRLQVLTDLATLPDYDQGYYFYRYHQEYTGAPVDEAGNPVYHQLPKSWEESKTDGERWRWLLAQAAEIAPNRTTEIRKHFADFLWGQFGVQTMGDYGRFFGRFADDGPTKDDDTKKDESGTYALHTLGEDETIAKLANGIKRFKLPDEFNFIKIYREVADAGKDTHCEGSLTQLCQIFENRRQYPKAAELWRRAIKEYGPGENNWRGQRLDQIVGNWGRFEPDATQAAGKGATFDFRFRNGTQVTFEAHAIAVDKLLDDVKAYIKTRPQRLEWEKLNIQDIGQRLIHKDEKKYLGEKVADWKLDLEPRENHFDKRVTVTSPLQKPGAYLVRAKMTDGADVKGNTNYIVMWIADTAIVKKPIQGQTMYFLADATTGAPIVRSTVEFFGYRQRHIKDSRFEIDVKNFAEYSNADGQVRLDQKRLPEDHQWLVIARGPGGRFSYLGFDNIWYANYEDGAYNEKKIFAISDRPVYRPGQPVKFNFWAGRARYDAPEDKSEFAGHNATLTINNPKGEKVLEKKFKLDDYGGLHDEWTLPADATLGQYYAQITVHRGILNGDFGGYLQFRVEEYKKPEFEVTVDAPKEPVKLGDKIKAKITAKYYFGSPVTEAKVKYKIVRSSHNAEWFPRAPWDWFYGPGYWWFAYDYVWYPGWRDWGCWRPYPWWRGGRWEQPELIAENEAQIGADGTFEVEIDTGPAKAVHADQDHKYSITAEVVDQSRRTIVGSGDVLVARKPFKVYAWIDRGYVKTGDTIEASFNAQTLDQNPVKGAGTLRLLKISYEDGENPKPVETEVGKWELPTGDDGRASQKITMREPGQYRLSCEVTDAKENKIEGGYVFTVIGQGFDGGNARFNDVELIPDKREYQPGETVKLQINTNRAGGTVLLFMRPVNGVCPPPKLIKLTGKTHVEEFAIAKNDMPNFFVEAVTVSGGRVHSDAKEIVVPPEKRVVNVEVKPSATEYKPGEKAKFVVKVTDQAGKPFIGSTVISMYDKAVEYISGGTNVPEIKEFFWKWRRHYHSYVEHNLNRYIYSIVPPKEVGMGDLGVFGGSVADELADGDRVTEEKAVTRFSRNGRGFGGGGIGGPEAPMAMESLAADAAPAPGESRALRKSSADAAKKPGSGGEGGQGGENVTPTVRQNFADTAYWAAGITTNNDGVAEISLDMPENLTTWKCKVWSLGHGSKVGEAATEVVTRKNIIVRLQAPRFFVQKDEVVLSANVHNYLKADKDIRVVLKLDGEALEPLEDLARTVQIKAGGERRVDWRVRAKREGEVTIQMQALTDEESDATQMKFPVFVHGFAKTESYSGAIRPDDKSGEFTIRVPEERRPEQSRLEVRYSPTLAGAMVDALPYLADYPYGCTEQTLNRFLPTVITQKILLDMKLDLKAIQEKRTNLNAQEIGDDVERAKGWKRFDRNPVFDVDEVKKMVKEGVDKLTEMQLSDGGWGWFSGYYEHSTAHTTAVVVHGLQVAKASDVALVPGMLERGVKWLENYQNEQVTRLKNAVTKTNPWKERADEIDAFVFMVLTDAGVKNADMLGFLDRDRVKLAVYGKALFGLACHTLGEKDKLAEVMKNIDQYVVHDDENQTAYLKLPADNYWWYWYGSENEAMAYYLKLLAKLDAKSKTASGLVKYLLNNRKHATYWNSTRDTALCIEAMADYLKASGESRPDMTVEVWVDGKKVKDAKITAENLFTFDNKFVLEGEAVRAGSYKVELKKSGTGPLYYNGYLTNFTLEDPITKAGLEIKVERRYYKLVRVEKNIKAQGSRGQAVDQKVEKYDRVKLDNLALVKSGDLIEIELEIESKNDYEYILFEDMKAAGCEPFDVRSGYGGKGLPAYIELRDNRVALFLRQLARGKHSIAYKMRAEIPGTFSALPTKASAMYAPELKANSDEIKLRIED